MNAVNSYYAGVAMVLTSAAAFGVMPFFAIVAYQENVGVVEMLLLRFALAGLIMFLYIGLKRLRPDLSRKTLLSLLGLGVLYTLQAWFYFSAVKYISASLAVLMLYVYPVFVALLSRLILKEALPKINLLAILISSAGLTLVLGASPAGINAFGIALGLGAALCYGSYIFFSSRVVQTLSPVVVFAVVSLVATPAFLAAGLFSGELVFQLTLRAWLGIGALVLFSTLLSMLLLLKGLELIGATKAATLSMAEPLVTVIVAAVLFGERLTAIQFLGGFGVVAGALITILARRPVQAAKEQ